MNKSKGGRKRCQTAKRLPYAIKKAELERRPLRYDRTFTTDKNGEIIIEGLRIGDYTISEVQDSVSASYVLPADKIATVKVGSTIVL